MKRWLSFLLALALGLLPLIGGAEGITLHTSSTLAGGDPAAQAYMDLLEEWQEQTGNPVEDFSDVTGDQWRDATIQQVKAGELDVFSFFTGAADIQPILADVVPISEVVAAYPDMAAKLNPIMAQADGNVYAIPIRPFWEGLYVNQDLFEANGLALPTDWGKLNAAIEAFRAKGITPISLSLSEMPDYILEAAILACGPVAEHDARPGSQGEIPGAWYKGMQLLRLLNEMGAFGPNAATISEMDATDLFLNKQAAMQFDGSWLASMIAPDNWETTLVIPFPACDPGADPTAVVGGVSMGFYITRSAWNDPLKREAAVSLLNHLTSDVATSRLGFFFGGALLESARQMVGNAKAFSWPILDDMTTEARTAWFEQLMGMATGTADIQQVMGKVVDMGAFQGE